MPSDGHHEHLTNKGVTDSFTLGCRLQTEWQIYVHIGIGHNGNNIRGHWL